MPSRKREPSAAPSPDAPVGEDAVKALRHPAKRKNIPPAGLEAQGRVEEAPKLRHHYNPHLPPVLRFAADGEQPAAADCLPMLLQTARERALSADEAQVLAEALRRHEPWLEWSGKRERPWFEVEPPALHIHERVSTQAMLRVLAREDVNRDLFADPQQSYAEAVQFYRHDVDWANRMILGDSLAVMASLARREDLAAKVQMIYIDPPYGISFKSNFQPQLGQRDVKDREQDLTREPEMVKAYRDTWTLGIHSYLAYLRDRLAMAKELLTDSGSVFVQISDENLHRVRMLMDEVFGAENFVSVVSFKTTTTGSGDLLASVDDFLIWYARDKPRVKFNAVYQLKDREPDGIYKYLEFPSGHELTLGTSHDDNLGQLTRDSRLFSMDNITSSRPAGDGDLKSYNFRAQDFPVTKGTFKSDAPGLRRLERANRLGVTGSTLRYKRFVEDFAVKPMGNMWTDTSTGSFTESSTNAVTEADQRRWLLPGTHPAAFRDAPASKPLKAVTAKQAAAYRAAIPATDWKPWQVPFDADADWPVPLARALAAYRTAWRAKMDEVNACIAANAEMEELVDQPEPEPGVVRVAGPFTMEGVIAREQSEDEQLAIVGAPDELDTFGDGAGDGGMAAVNAEAHLDKVIRLLMASGVDFAGNNNQRFARLEPIVSSALIHAEGHWVASGEAEGRRVAVSIGREVGNVTAFQVEDAVRSANRAGYDEAVFAGFGFDAAAQAAIDEASHPRLRLHMALIRPDVAMGDLLKAQPGSQLFMVFSAPRVKPPQRLADGQWTVEVEGMDVYDPVSNALFATSRDRIAAWFVDTDDGRCFCICQAFFPDRKKWDKLARALGERGVVDEGRFDALTGWASLPFARPPRLPAGAPWRVGVKVIDPRGNEGLRVITMAVD